MPRTPKQVWRGRKDRYTRQLQVLNKLDTSGLDDVEQVTFQRIIERITADQMEATRQMIIYSQWDTVSHRTIQRPDFSKGKPSTQYKVYYTTESDSNGLFWAVVEEEKYRSDPFPHISVGEVRKQYFKRRKDAKIQAEFYESDPRHGCPEGMQA